MAKINVTADFDHRLNPRTVVALKAGMKGVTVKRETAEAAVNAGKAEWVDQEQGQEPAKVEPQPSADEQAIAAAVSHAEAEAPAPADGA